MLSKRGISYLFSSPASRIVSKNIHSSSINHKMIDNKRIRKKIIDNNMVNKKILNNNISDNKKNPNNNSDILSRSDWVIAVSVLVSIIYIYDDLKELFFDDNKNKDKNNLTVPKIDLNSLGGNEKVKEYFSDIILYLKNPEEYSKLGLRNPKGVILSGPPGVGKSYFAEAVAGQAGCSFIRVNASTFFDKWVGQTEQKLRDVFKQARAAAPCILCFDEIDSLASKRFTHIGDGYEKYSNGVVNQLLELLEKENPGVVVIATTNNFDSIDPALGRPGRFNQHIRIPLPDFDSRFHILNIHLKDKKLHAQVSLNTLSLLSEGYSGAKLAEWINQASLIAVHTNNRVITMDHFDQAMMTVEFGVLNPNTNQIQKRRTANHEAGHALVGHLLGQHIYKISTNQYGDLRGFTLSLPEDTSLNLTKEKMLDNICISLAGRAAEQLSGIIQGGSGSDFERAKEIAKMMIASEGMGATLTGMNSSSEIEYILDQQMKRAFNLIKTNQAGWRRLSDALVEYDELRRDDLITILENKKISKKYNDPSPVFFKVKQDNVATVTTSAATTIAATATETDVETYTAKHAH